MWARYYADLILTDVMMPYMSGYELIDAVRKLPEGSQIGGVEVPTYSFNDFERRAPTLWLVGMLLLIFSSLLGAGAGSLGSCSSGRSSRGGAGRGSAGSARSPRSGRSP